MKLSKTEYGYSFHCPGCGEKHTLYTSRPNGYNWSFNGDVANPTFSPSLLITCGHYSSGHKSGDDCWCSYNLDNPDEPSPFRCSRCHSFIENGRIRFLSDSTHSLAGQTVDIPDFDGK